MDGEYVLHCNSILQMIQADDLLQVKGKFDTQSFMNHESMLRNGRMELWGDFNQEGDKTAFASSENFVIAFMGSGQKAHFDDVGYSRFANIDPDHGNVEMKDKPLTAVANFGMSVGRGVVSGLQEALGDLELSASAAAVSAAIGISLSALEAPIVVAVVAIFSLIAGVIGTIQSLFMIAQSAGGIYSTAAGTGTVYDKEEAFAHDFTIMVVGIITLTGSVKSIEASMSSFKSAAQELFGRKKRLTPSEVTKTYKGAKLITSFDDFTEYAKGFLDEDALQYVKEVLGNDADDTAKLKKVAQLIEDGSGKIGKKLSKEELKAGLDALWNDGGVEGALVAIEIWSKGGGATIAKETNKFVEYVNRAGQKIRIPKQSGKNIDNSIASKLNSTKDGDRIEAKVANFIKNDMGKELTDFGNKVRDTSSGLTIGDIDCGMEDVLIEVKKSVGNVKIDQFYKYVNYDEEKYVNILNKKVILYIDEAMGDVGVANEKKLQTIEKMGVTIVNGLEELKGVLE